MHSVQAKNYKVKAQAFTGIAAALLDGGVTIHSRFGLPVPLLPHSTSRFALNSHEAEASRTTKLLVFDEAAMIPKGMMKAVDRFLRYINGQPDVLFGGQCVLLGGDFRQILPIDTISNNSVGISLKCWSDWSEFKKFKLVKNMRADPEEIEFAKWVLQVGDDKIKKIKDTDLIRIPDDLVAGDNEDVVDTVFGHGLITVQSTRDLNRGILCPKNIDALKLNERVLDRMEGILKRTTYSLIFIIFY